MELIACVRKVLSDNQLISSGGNVLAALSGGPDSVALVHVLSGLRKEFDFQLGAVYINHQIRPRAAREEEAFCQKLCDRLKVQLHIVRENIPYLATVVGKGIEETARDFRYRTFESIASHHGYTRIALGHHRDDQVETILFRIIRGTGPSGLTGIPLQRGKIIRPLLGVTKADILAYLKKHRLSYCRDFSNESLEYSRNYIRHKLLPEIRKRLNPQVDLAVSNLAEIIGPEEDHLRQVTQRAARQSIKTTSGGKIELDLEPFENYPLWLRRRLLRFCLQKSSGGHEAPARETVDRLADLVRERGKGLSLPGRLEATIIGECLVLRRRQSLHFSVPLLPGQEAEIPLLHVRVRSRVVPRRGKGLMRRRRSPSVTMDWSQITEPLVVRAIRPGDRFRPLGMAGQKKVGDFLTDRKVAPVFRDEIPVVCDSSGIVWLVGFEIADRVKVVGTTRKVLKLEIASDQDSDPEAV